MAVLQLLVLWLCAYIAPAHSSTVPFSIELTPENEAAVVRAVGLYNQARQAVELGEPHRAVHLYEDAIDAYPLLATAYNNLGMLVYDMTKDLDLAFELLARSADAATQLGDNATLAAARNNMGFFMRSRHEQSVAYCLRAIEFYDQALEAVPDFVDAMYNKASALTSLRQFHEAQPLLRRVLELDPQHISAHMDMGAIYFERGDIDRAVYHEDAIIAVAPLGREKLGAMHNKGVFLKAGERMVEALRTHEEAVALAPDHATALTDLVVVQRSLCLWEAREALIDRMLHAVMKQHKDEKLTALLPYDSTLLELSDRVRKSLAIAHARLYQQSSTLDLRPLQPIVATDSQPSRRLRIGYATYDFRDHPMGHLTLGLLDAHDPSLVETYCYSYGVNDGSEWRRRAEQRCDVFRDGRSLSDLEFARTIAHDEVDILVDLMAHTTGARLGLSSLRPSRIVVNYLGYPGTMGSSFTDFVIADRFVLPPEVAGSSMTEQVVYLPHAYQVNQYDREIPACHAGDNKCTRAIRIAEGLPEDAIVFCNVNTIDKMEPVSFGVWMNVLRRVPTGVLWLLQPSRIHRSRIEETLRDEAKQRGVDPTRIFFASRKSKRDHLARLSAADLFLDSFVYNAHSTAADALWANVPIVSLWGDTFPSRVAGSLIQNLVGLPELVPHSVKEYEDLAVHLAENVVLLGRLRVELAKQALIAPLFDTHRIARHIEHAYEAMHDVCHHLAVRTMPIPQRFQLAIAPSTSLDPTPTANSERLLRDAITTGIALQERNEFLSAKAVYERVLGVAPRHSDAMHLLGLILYQMGNSEDAAQQLGRTVDTYSTIPLFRYNHAVVLAGLSRQREAESELLKALALDPSYVDAFFKLTDLLLDETRFAEMVRVYEQFGATVLRAETISSTDCERGYLQFSFALAKTNRVQDAIDMLESALASHPTFFRLGFNLAAIRSSEGEYESANQQMIHTTEAEARHMFATRGSHFAKHTRPVNRQVVVFYCHEYGQSWWPTWGPSSLLRGLGGSEEAVVFMSRELQRLGYWVEVYGDPPHGDVTNSTTSPHDGVRWYPHYTYDPDDHGVDIFIAWRYHVSLAVGRHSTRKLFWAHDLPSEDTMRSQLLQDLADGILCVSEYHASFFPHQLKAKLIITSNALDPAYFVDNNELSAYERSRRFVYGSSPSRGLFELLQMWPRIRARLPDATLRVFYGFTPAFIAWGRHNIVDFDVWKRTMDKLLQQPGVSYVGLVDHETLATEYASAGFYLYPTTFKETSCVSLMKAMANGAIPITSRFPLSAMNETTAGFDLGPSELHLDSSIFEGEEWLDVWVESVVQAATHVTHNEDLRKQMIQFARNKYQWRTVASKWQALFNALLVELS